MNLGRDPNLFNFKIRMPCGKLSAITKDDKLIVNELLCRNEWLVWSVRIIELMCPESIFSWSILMAMILFWLFRRAHLIYSSINYFKIKSNRCSLSHHPSLRTINEVDGFLHLVLSVCWSKNSCHWTRAHCQDQVILYFILGLRDHLSRKNFLRHPRQRSNFRVH
jgi:hypothetical protein